MKHKILLVIISLFLSIGLATSIYAFSLEKEFKKITKDVDASVKNVTDIDKKIDKTLDSLKKEVIGKVDVHIKEYKDKIEAEEKKIRKVIADVEDGIKRFEEVKAKLPTYIKIAKIVIVILSSGILILIFIIFRIWRNIVTMKKAFKAVVNYDKVNKRIEELEKQLYDLKKV